MGAYVLGSELVEAVLAGEHAGLVLYDCLCEGAACEPAREAFCGAESEQEQHVEALKRLLKYAGTRVAAESYPGEYGNYVKGLMGSQVFVPARTCREMGSHVCTQNEAHDAAVIFEKEIIARLKQLREFVPDSEQSLVQDLLETEKEHFGRFRSTVGHV